MPTKFDPVGDRQFWLDFSLKHELRFEPETVPPKAWPHLVAGHVSTLVDAYFLGLADSVKPSLETIIAWMDAQPEPDPGLWLPPQDHWRDAWTAQYLWHQTLGLAKWLSRGETSEGHFSAALDAEWRCWRSVDAEKAAFDHGRRQLLLSEQLAVALAAREPGLGLKLYEDVGVRDPSAYEAPLLQFGRWACRHLALGGSPDAAFVARGADMLRASLLSNFLWGGNISEAALWLKAVYWDSGAARTPEQAFGRAYDCMPGIERPDFVPV